MEMSRFLYEVGFCCACAQFVTLPRCPDVDANHPIDRNYGNSVRFLAKIPNGTAAESPCYSVFWNAIDLCSLYTSKKNLNVGPANRPAFCRQVPLFYTKCPSKNILQVGRSDISICDFLRMQERQANKRRRRGGRMDVIKF